MLAVAIVALVVGCVSLCIQFVAVFLVVIRFQELKEALGEQYKDYQRQKEIEAEGESSIVHDDPAYLKQKREKRIRMGEDPEDGDSQIIKTKTPARRQEEAEAAKEERLDKWMPGVKRG